MREGVVVPVFIRGVICVEGPHRKSHVRRRGGGGGGGGGRRRREKAGEVRRCISGLDKWLVATVISSVDLALTAITFRTARTESS